MTEIICQPAEVFIRPLSYADNDHKKKLNAAYLEIINGHWEATVKLADLRYFDLLRKC